MLLTGIIGWILHLAGTYPGNQPREPHFDLPAGPWASHGIPLHGPDLKGWSRTAHLEARTRLPLHAVPETAQLIRDHLNLGLDRGSHLPNYPVFPGHRTTMPYKTVIRLLVVARNPTNGFPARLLVLQRRFLNLPSSWSEIAPREERPQGWQARGQVAMEMCSRSFYCEQSL